MQKIVKVSREATLTVTSAIKTNDATVETASGQLSTCAISQTLLYREKDVIAAPYSNITPNMLPRVGIIRRNMELSYPFVGKPQSPAL